MSRIEKIRELMVKNSIDGVFINYIPNIRYLTNFSGSSASVILSRTKNFFITDFRYKDQSYSEVKGFEIIINYNNMSEFRSIIENEGIKKIGFESTHLTYNSLMNAKEQIPGTEFYPLKEEIEKLTMNKLPEEISNLKKAAEISDETFKKILEIIKPGMKELDVAAEITYLHQKLGATQDSFNPIIASGWRGALPHGRASNKIIENGEMVTLDFGCTYEGFCSDITRTISLGKPNEELKKIYNIVYDAQTRAIEKASTKLSSKQLDSVARDIINSKGFGENFGHGLGHGLGIDVHELPSISQRMDIPLVENCVVTIEPGIYIEKLGGVRIEDDVVLHSDGCEVLNKSPKELIIL
jgi:Xaa-Pro aminopeptidase